MTEKLSSKAQGRPLIRGWDWDHAGEPYLIPYGEDGYCPQASQPGAMTIYQFWQGLDDRLQRFQAGDQDIGFQQDPQA